MIRILFFFCLVASSTFAFNELQGTTPLPLEGLTFSDTKIKIPETFHGRLVLLCFGFSRKSQADFKSWVDPFKKRYLSNNEISHLEVAMIGRKSKIETFFIQKGMKAGIPKSSHNNVMAYFGDIKQFKDYYGFSHKEKGYFLLLDKNSTIIWQNFGKATDKEIDKLFNLVDEIMEDDN